MWLWDLGKMPRWQARAYPMYICGVEYIAMSMATARGCASVTEALPHFAPDRAPKASKLTTKWSVRPENEPLVDGHMIYSRQRWEAGKFASRHAFLRDQRQCAFIRLLLLPQQSMRMALCLVHQTLGPCEIDTIQNPIYTWRVYI